MGEKQIPMFFRCFSADDRVEKLHLPESWCSFMGRSLPSKAFLRNRHGDSWEVRVANYQNSDEFWLEKGWSTFIEQNKVVYNDHIVFKYDGKSTFDFKLFDEKNNEKEYVRIPNLKPQSQSKKLEEQQDMQIQSEAEPQLDPEPEEWQDMQPEPEDDDWEEDDDFEAENTRSRRKVTRKQAPRISEEAIFQSGIPRPNNPYFVIERRDKREQLYIPKEIVQDFNLTFPEQIGIHDEKGHEWKGKVHKWTDGRIWFSEGWRALCKWNNVKRGDLCVIEIVRPQIPEVEIYLKTHLVPAAALTAARRS